MHSAQANALAAARNGTITAEVDAAARNTLAAQGYAQYFTHRLGHGTHVVSQLLWSTLTLHQALALRRTNHRTSVEAPRTSSSPDILSQMNLGSTSKARFVDNIFLKLWGLLIPHIIGRGSSRGLFLRA